VRRIITIINHAAHHIDPLEYAAKQQVLFFSQPATIILDADRSSILAEAQKVFRESILF
jgi:hypothetical protein